MLTFESLPNEVFLELFRFFDFTELLKSFNKLNLRFDKLIFDESSRYSLDLSSISPNEFDEFCEKSFPLIENRLISCRFSDEFQCRNVFEWKLERFSHLNSLIIDQIYSFDLLNLITAELEKLPVLTFLRLRLDNRQEVEEKHSVFLTNIWSLKKLTDVHLILNYYFAFFIFDLTTPSTSIRSVKLDGFSHDWGLFKQILKKTPNLKHFGFANFKLSFGENDENKTIFPSLSSLEVNLRYSIDYTKKFFTKTPNLRSLNLKIDKVPFDGEKLEEIFRQFLPQLVRFRLQMQIEFSPSDDFEVHVDKLLQTFRSDFWLIEHRWFVRCVFSVTKFQRIGFLHTIPFPSDSLTFIDGSQTKSTEFVEENPFSQVKNLTFVPRQNDFTEWKFPFVSLRHLTSTFPLGEHFWSIVPNFDQLKSLDVTLNRQFASTQIQMLLDRATRLFSFRFSSSTDFSLKMFQFRCPSIRQLEVFPTSILINRYLTDEECLDFATTPLAAQCEILIIDVENGKSLVELIKKMTNLRLLKVRCLENLFDNLPKTCVESISRNPLEYDRVDVILRRR